MWVGKGKTIYHQPRSCPQRRSQNTPPYFPSKTPPVPFVLWFLNSWYVVCTIMLPEARLLYLQMPDIMVGIESTPVNKKTRSLL